MFIGIHAGKRIDATEAAKGLDHTCPRCAAEVILKRGRIVVPHFAHKASSNCDWASGETREHLTAKKLLRDALREMGYLADYEVEILTGQGDRRADILAENKNGVKIAFEIQHTPILYDDIEKRTNSYLSIGVPVVWVGLLTKGMKRDAEPKSYGLKIEKYSIRPWEKWAHAYYFKNLWYLDVEDEAMYLGKFDEFAIDVPQSSWYSQAGEEMSAGGYTRISRRWKVLALDGPRKISDLKISIRKRNHFKSKYFSLPAGPIAKLQ